MGCWGNGTFENDDAEELLVACLRFQDPQVIMKALHGNFDSDDGSLIKANEALAAAELVAAKLGYPSAGFPDDPEAWNDLKKLPLIVTPQIVHLSLEAVRHIQKESDLKDEILASIDASDYTEWVQILDDLVARLNQALLSDGSQVL